jgi:2,3-bisphosphoglycerate-dependent phosphoglycerate mutase
MATTLVLARHGETDWNREHRLQGWADPPLNEVGRDQARELAEALGGERFDAVYSSDLRRAAETARIVASRLGLGSVIEDVSLREVDLGSWSGRLRDEIVDGRRATGDGESREQHRDRVVAGVLRLAAAHEGERLLVVSHGGSLRALEAFATGETPRPLANCESFTMLVDDGRLRLVEAQPVEPPREPEADDADALDRG